MAVATKNSECCKKPGVFGGFGIFSNHTGLYSMSAIYPFLAPAESRGKGLIRYRYADPNKGDNTWIWKPGDRRLKLPSS